MIQEVQLDKEIIILDSEKIYSGEDNLSDDEKLVRKAIGLPVKKQLVYYKDKCDVCSVAPIKEYQLVEMFNLTNRWYTVEITLEDDTRVRIHSSFLVEMQKPSFVADMTTQAE